MSRNFFPENSESQSSDPENCDRQCDDSTDEEGLTLEELSQTYARVIGQDSALSSDQGHSPTSTDASDLSQSEPADRPGQNFDSLAEDLSDAEGGQVTPASILEAILFVGRGDNQPISSEEIAGLMRGVRADEIDGHVAELNRHYRQLGSPLQIVAGGGGLRMQLVDDLRWIRDRFYGPQREAKLNQASVDCLALIAYQPGIQRKQLEEQRGQPSGAVLSQLVRRQLIEVKREGGKSRQLHYYPTSKLMQLIGLESLEDLPQVEDWQ